MDTLVATRRPFVDGALIAGEGPLVQVESPATGELVCEVEGASSA
jgi:hypothetical protein